MCIRDRRHAIRLEEGVLLLDSEPGDEGVHLLHRLRATDTGVVLNGGHVGLVAVAHDQDIFPATEGIGKDGLGLQEHLGVVPGSLASGGAIEVPDGPMTGVGERKRVRNEWTGGSWGISGNAELEKMKAR